MLRIIESLKAKQITEGLNDLDFAQKLGTNRITWRNLKLGKYSPSRRVLSAIMQIYPELEPEMLEYLKGNHNEG